MCALLIRSDLLTCHARFDRLHCPGHRTKQRVCCRGPWTYDGRNGVLSTGFRPGNQRRAHRAAL